ncbi:hypothetical protein BDF14DRAFT_1783955 [Spinellus fusiger]|nr:hypothetical protein BDF14DRAFT_1783955 [Spinellus fusiger]
MQTVTSYTHISINLPDAIILTVPATFLLYTTTTSCGLWALYKKKSIPISPWKLRATVAIFGFCVPLVFLSSSIVFNLSFGSLQWFILGTGCYLPTHNLSYFQWVRGIFPALSYAPSPALVDGDKNTHANTASSTGDVRINGLVTMGRGFTKLALAYCFAEPLVKKDVEHYLALPLFSIESIVSTFLFGAKTYLVFASIDIMLGLCQTLTGIPMVDMFDSPILSYSPKDFWNRRWNRVVHDIFRRLNNVKDAEMQVQSKKHDTVGEISGAKKQSTPLSRNAKGFLTFLLSGVGHDMLDAINFRRMTFENVLFFGIHGIVVYAEVSLLKRFFKEPTGLMRIPYIVLNMTFLSLTGKIFLAPILTFAADKSIATF